MDSLTQAGLGLDYGVVRLERTTEDWLVAGTALRDQIAEVLAPFTAGVATIGSSSVRGLLAKPIVDLAVGLRGDQGLAAVTTRLEAEGWIYRGDTGNAGGHVFVLETRPWHRVAHLHVVEYNGPQWHDYLRFRDLLRSSPEARQKYEGAKLRLVDRHSDNRKAYQGGKAEVVGKLLDRTD